MFCLDKQQQKMDFRLQKGNYLAEGNKEQEM